MPYRIHRPTNAWDDGDLPAPYAEGDIIDVPDGAKTLERMHGMGPGRYVVTYATSIDEGDAWYFRIAPNRKITEDGSDRLHVWYAERTDAAWIGESENWLEGCTLVRTKDPEGFAQREAMIAGGWMPPHHDYCPTCGHEIRP